MNTLSLAVAVLCVFACACAAPVRPEPSGSPLGLSPSPNAESVPTTPPGPAVQSTPLAVGTPSPTAGDTPLPLNLREVTVINALAALEIKGQRAQLPYEDASIWADLGGGSFLFVHAGRTGTDRGVFTVIDERQVQGIRVQRVQYGTNATHRFECSGDTYTVSGFIEMYGLVARFIRALGCAA
jgi:hypothetical protein